MRFSHFLQRRARRFSPLLLVVAFACAFGLMRPAPALAARDAAALFAEEMQQAVGRLKWRGERLSDDTVYAIALTGLSWEPAWGREDLFSMAWGDRRKTGKGSRRENRNYLLLTGDIRKAYEARSYAQAVNLASTNFSLDEIGCDPNLKAPVGFSLLAMGHPERAFPLLASPFEPSRNADVAAANRRFREAAFEAAQQAGLAKEAIAFGLSLLLEPGTETPTVHEKALDYLEGNGVDVDRVLLGILQAPPKLRGLPQYEYAAADLLTYRATPRHLPILLHLTDSEDVHLRSRALIALGILAYRARPDEPRGWASDIVVRPLREYGLSADVREFIAREVGEAVRDGSYRLRAAGALALALMGDEASVPTLRKLAQDRAYILTAPYGEDRQKPMRIVFPVRLAAATGLARFGIVSMPGGGELQGKALAAARRGGKDVTHDRHGLRRAQAGQVHVSALDIAIAQPPRLSRR